MSDQHDEALEKNFERLEKLKGDRLNEFKRALETLDMEMPEFERIEGVEGQEGMYRNAAGRGLKAELAQAAAREDEALRKARE